jgi:hypothetical protein
MSRVFVTSISANIGVAPCQLPEPSQERRAFKNLLAHSPQARNDPHIKLMQLKAAKVRQSESLAGPTPADRMLYIQLRRKCHHKILHLAGSLPVMLLLIVTFPVK